MLYRGKVRQDLDFETIGEWKLINSQEYASRFFCPDLTFQQLFKSFLFSFSEIEYHLSKGSGFNYFWTTAFAHSRCANLRAKLWTKVGMTMEEKIQLCERLADVSPYFR